MRGSTQDQKQKRDARKRLRPAIRDSIIAQATGGQLSQVLFPGGVLSLLILFLGRGDMEIGLIFMVFHLCRMTGVFLLPYLEVRSRKRMLYLWRLISIASISLIFLIFPVYHWFGNLAAFWFLVFVIFLYRTSDDISGNAWMPFLYDLLPAAIRGRYYGRMRMSIHAASFLGMFVAGWLLGKNPDFLHFYLVFAIFIFIASIRIVYIRRLPEIPPQRRGRPESLWQNLKRPFLDKRFRLFLLFIFILSVVDQAGKPFVVPFLRVNLEFPTSITVYASACMAIGSIISLLLWGKVADRLGNRFVFFLSFIFIVFSYSIFLVSPSYPANFVKAFLIAVAGFILQGIGYSGAGIAYAVRLMHETKEEFSGAYIVVSNVMIGIAASSGPLISGALLDSLPQSLHVLGFDILTKRIFFLIICLLVTMMLFLLRRLPRIKEARTSVILKNILYTSLNRVGEQMTYIRRLLKKK